MQINKTQFILHTMYRNKSKIAQDLNEKAGTVKHLEENIGEKLDFDIHFLHAV